VALVPRCAMTATKTRCHGSNVCTALSNWSAGSSHVFTPERNPAVGHRDTAICCACFIERCTGGTDGV
jgi:hypothetical protein